jgi:cytosine/creatinine deaminase
MAIDILLKNARLPGSDQPVDLAIDAGKILECGPALSYSANQQIDAQGRLVSPGFVEPHLHLDIALSNSREHPGRPQHFTSPAELNPAMEARRKSFTPEDITARAVAALEMASRHGVTAVRAQCHVDPEVKLTHLQALLAAKEKAAGLIDLQIVAFPQQGLFAAGIPELFAEAFRLGADVMGCASNLGRGSGAPADYRAHLDTALEMAVQFGVDLDAHVDLTLPQQVALDELESVYLAGRAVACGYTGRVTAGHCCSLDSALPDVQAQAIEAIARAGMSVISQPDLYRLGRGDGHHVRRGLPPVRALLAAGVNTCLASNNVRDPFRPLGNLNPLEEALILAYGAHMDSTAELETLFQMVTLNPARALKLPAYGLEPGCRADLVVLDAPSPAAAVAGQALASYVIKNGRLIWRSQVTSERCD